MLSVILWLHPLAVFILIFCIINGIDIVLRVKAQQAPSSELTLNSQLFDAEWSADGQYFALASQNGVLVYSDTLELIASFQGNTGNVISVTWSPTGDYSASAGGRGDNTIRIWQFNRNTGTFSQIQVMTIPASVVFLVKWSPDGSKLASVSLADSILTNIDRAVGMVDVWNTQTWIRINQEPLFLFATQRALTWNSDSRKLAVAGEGGAAIIELDTYKVLYNSDNLGTYGSEITNVDWSTTNQIALASSQLFIWKAP